MRAFLLMLVAGVLAFIAGDIYGVRQGYLPGVEGFFGDDLTLEEQADRAQAINPDSTTQLECSNLRAPDGNTDRYRYFLVRSNNSWQVKVSRRDQPLGVFNVKQDAEDLAVQIARSSCPSRLDIQNMSSDFIEVRIYG